jgi:hypothetical protein
MGFLDKAKKMAEQAQTKLDDVQKQVNENQGASQQASGDPVTEYDQHGRSIGSTPPPAPEAAAAPPPPAAPAPEPQPDRDDEYAPPNLTAGDPLEG